MANAIAAQFTRNFLLILTPIVYTELPAQHIRTSILDILDSPTAFSSLRNYRLLPTNSFPITFSIAAYNCGASTGLDTYPSIPASRHRASSPFNACAVIATIATEMATRPKF
jgi:hypothetical protein